MSTRRKDFQESNPDAFLPSPEVLAAYEKMAPGATKELIALVKKEQEHRHKWQDRYLESHNFTYRFGQVIGMLYILGLLYVVFNLIVMKEMQFSVVLMCIVLFLVFTGMLLTRCEREHMKKRPRQELMRGKDGSSRGASSHMYHSSHHKSGRHSRR